jgi:hypothetical protein
MWYVMDKEHKIVVCSVPTRAEAYKMRTMYAWTYPKRAYKVVREAEYVA